MRCVHESFVAARRSITSSPPLTPAARPSCSFARDRKLDRLSELVGAAESEAPRVQTEDLVEVVHEAVDIVRQETESWPVVVVSSDIDPDRARTAVVTLVGIANVNSGMAEPVVGSVARRRNSATIIGHDRDPSPCSSYRDRIFHPFVPGTNGPGTPSGSGLNLHLMRRIVAGHGGSVPAGTADGRSAFRIELPFWMKGRHVSAS
jgi:two-component system, OmpR family, sensor histidine kinase TrcS